MNYTSMNQSLITQINDALSERKYNLSPLNLNIKRVHATYALSDDPVKQIVRNLVSNNCKTVVIEKIVVNELENTINVVYLYSW